MQSPQAPRDGTAAAKTALRDQVLAARRQIPLAELGEHARAIARHLLATHEVRRAATVAAYVSVGREPGTSLLVEELAAAGKRVIVPVVLPDLDLDWATWAGEAALASAGRGLLEPTTPRLGAAAVATADAVLVPGLAVDPAGHRLGRGGGCYDRALARVPAGTFTCVLLHDGEVGLPVPVAPHDRPVTAAVTPGGGVVRLTPAT
ncbi:5-formyltetrahydrofolate cyclo-ligase [Nocardioides coralli]|uniref:5-formyltetrahydrofolate cyclo-ligase n=1 Tax=Nocardioides coralli TaxID=2872154 RepID=UPI001CA40C18|nr:5-formyltetrahydrofolate cyclo-ligase [Nocardioides coralli]QZY29585.1 5-formyltetrahydrofolate cyclo-ligase [Nocardioides coralli]